MKKKVLAAIMKLQAAQIMLSNEGIQNTLSTHVTEHGNLELTAIVNGPSEASTAIQILDTYSFAGAEFQKTTIYEGTPKEFTVYVLLAYISKIED